ncbi:MAG: M23 family metallopeptidase [Thermoleophilia bacterium]
MLLKVLVRTLLSSFLVATAIAPGALAAPPRKGKALAAGVPSPLVFPVVGDVSYTDDFGDPRGQGRHEGNDLMAPKRSPVVAAEAGEVRVYNGSSRAGCMLYLYGASGTTYLYIHLNNDVTAGNDNRGGCVTGVAYAPGLRNGQRVRAGQLIGYVGDSGDANGVASHLHFEVHPEGGDAVDPFPYLATASRLLFAVPESKASKAKEQAVGGLRLALYGTITAFGALPDGMPAVTLHVDRVRV